MMVVWAWAAGAVIGFACGYGEGLKVRAELAMRLLQQARRAARRAAVRGRQAQEARARHIAAHADEWRETKERGDTCA